MPSEPSSYLKFLPPALYEADPDDPDLVPGVAPRHQPLGGWLRIVEKLLTGINDGVSLPAGTLPIQDLVARFFERFDAWKAPLQFVEYMVTWGGLTLQPTWTEYQKRFAFAHMGALIRNRGTRKSLQFLLDLTAVDCRPQILIDEGGQVYSVLLRGDGVPVEPLPLVPHFPMMSPRGIIKVPGVTGGATYFVADSSYCLLKAGTEAGLSTGAWRISPDGYELTYPVGQPRLPQLLEKPAASFSLTNNGQRDYVYWQNLFGPMATKIGFAPLAFAARPGELFILAGPNNSAAPALYWITSPYTGTPTAIKLNANGLDATFGDLGLERPVAMAFRQGRLLILDRGKERPVGGGGAIQYPVDIATKIIEVELNAANFILSVTPHPFTGAGNEIVEPLSMCVLPTNGDILVGDGGVTRASKHQLVRIQTPVAGWQIVGWPMTNITDNPLIAPTAIAAESDDVFYVADAGLQPFALIQDWGRRFKEPGLTSGTNPPSSTLYNPFLRDVAEMPAVYKVVLSAAPPTITRITEYGRLCRPSGIAIGDGQLYVSDPGLQDFRILLQQNFGVPNVTEDAATLFMKPQTLAVSVNFSDERPTDATQRKRILQEVSAIVEREKPAHSDWKLLTLPDAP